MRPQDDDLHTALEKKEVVVADLETTADVLLDQGKKVAERLQGGFSNSIIAINSCGSAEVNELIALKKNCPEEIMRVIKAVCVLRNIHPANKKKKSAADGKNSEDEEIMARRRGRHDTGGGGGSAIEIGANGKKKTPPAVLADLHAYWDAAGNMLKVSERASHN